MESTLVYEFTAGSMGLATDVVVLFYLNVRHFHRSNNLFIIVDSIDSMVSHSELLLSLRRM